MNQPSLFFLLTCLAFPPLSMASPLIVIDDRGGVSALPYYQDLVPAPTNQQVLDQNFGVQGAGAFPVRSAVLTPGKVQDRIINAPGLQPLFVVGDDELSKSWLLQRREHLQQMNAVGVVVNVASSDRFEEVRRWAKDLEMVPAPGDDLASRLSIRHYPLLITATTIQQ
jgi:integrating conjugative element protein (TIGR03765 family)